MPAIDLLLSDDLSTFILQGSLQECDLTIPQSGRRPVVGLFVEERYVGYLFWPKVYHVLKGLVVEDSSWVEVIDLDISFLESYGDDTEVRTELNGWHKLPLLEVSQVVIHRALIICWCGFLYGIWSDTVTCSEVPHSYQAVDIDSEDPTAVNIDETAYKLSLAAWKHSVRTFVKASDLLLVVLHLWQHFVVEDIWDDLMAIDHLVFGWGGWQALNLLLSFQFHCTTSATSLWSCLRLLLFFIFSCCRWLIIKYGFSVNSCFYLLKIICSDCQLLINLNLGLIIVS